ncbi:MAG TPA: NAD(P)-dependent oxidoreductase [Devosia sp.]|nr:NAD(P)-dependent oxidoreductase [Devosia sp.]
MANTLRPRAVLVTGAGGNLGGQLVRALVSQEWCETIYCLDVQGMAGDFYDSPKCKIVFADLGDARDRRWQDVCEKADAIAHFAVRNPAPDGDWDDTVIAIDMTANLLNHLNPAGCRFLYASSNHAMGQYKDADWTGLVLKADTPPRPGTRYFAGGQYHQPNMYGGSKLTGERLVRAKAIASGGRLTGVSFRIGWCLKGDDDPRRINNRGGGGGAGGAAVQPAEEAARDLVWFRNMWLSHRDFVGAYLAGLTADAAGWPEPAVVVNAVSNNRGRLWDLDEAKAWIGYEPQDDVWTRLGIEPERSPFQKA